MTAEEKLAGILKILDIGGSSDAEINLEGVIADWDYAQRFDDISLKTIKRVTAQLSAVADFLK